MMTFSFSSFPLLVFISSIVIFNVRCIAEPDIPKTILRDGQSFPLVGLGVGNLQHDRIVAQVKESIRHGNRLIDTAHASQNEHLVRRGIREGLISFDSNLEIHVVTKVWYTYLGYERTKIAVREIMEELNDPNIKVHILLHWPRCRDDIPWMKCEEEEHNLPRVVKDAGPAPHLDKENAFKESWRALEDMFLGDVSTVNRAKLESIGVSNFGVEDLKALEKSRVTPHILQDNVWNYIYNPFLVNYCRDHEIHFQAYNVMNGILGRPENSPTAVNHLSTVSQDLLDRSEIPRTNLRNEVGIHQLILKWLIQQDVSVIPRTSSVQHVQFNSASTLMLLPDLADNESKAIDQCVKVMLQQKDLDQPQATFYNQHHETLHIFWSNEDGEEFLVKEGLKPGEKFDTETYPGHKFIAYDNARNQKKMFTVGVAYGEKEEFHVEL